MEKQPDQTPNFHEVAERRRGVRKTLREESSSVVRRIYEPKLEELHNEAEGFSAAVKEAGGTLSAAKDILRPHRIEAVQDKEAFAHGIDERKIRAELGEEYDTLKKNSGELDDLSDFEIRRLREINRDPYAQRMQGSLLEQIKREKLALKGQLTASELRDPTVARAFDLVQLREGLFEEGHIAHTPSVEDHLSQIGIRMIHGKPMFIHGPTGTGKTSLARYAAKHFTGKSPEMVYCTPQTRESQIWGKTGIRPAGEEGKTSGAIETVEIFGPLSRAMQEGTVVVFDEFTALPKEQMVFLKGVANAKSGDTIHVPGNGEIRITSGFQMIFTANLKSEKNPERQELPPEIAREFEQNNLEVGYTPKEEAYDIMLARLMRPDGSLEISQYDARTTLPKLCEAMAEIQIAYADQMSAETAKVTGSMDAAGRKSSLKKFVVTQGTVEAILESWPTERQLHNGISFAEYVDKRLATGLSFKEYPLPDRLLAAKIFASKGFLRTVTPEDLGLPANALNFDAARRSRTESVEKMRQESSKQKVVPLREVAELDPFGVRGKRIKQEADDLLGEEGGPEDKFLADMRKRAGRTFGTEALDVAEAQTENKAFLNKTFEGWYNAADAARAIDKVEAIDPASQDYKALASDKKQAEFGAYTLNPETQGLDFENLKAFVPDLAAFNGKKVHEVMQHVIDTYGDTHYIPGIEYWKWLCENPTKNPPGMQIKDGKYYFCPGSVLRGRDGVWDVPYASWDGTKWDRHANWLARGWFSDYRVVLLEK
mgnify:CR=1 FL=1